MPIELQPRDIQIIMAVDRYACLTRRQIGMLVGVSERIMRRRARLLAHDGYLNRFAPRASADRVADTPVYYPSKRGCQILSEHTGDDRYLFTKTSLPQKEIVHSLEVAQTHILLDQAVAAQQHVKLIRWINEHEVVDKSVADRSKHRTTAVPFEQVGQGKNQVICRPDSVFALECDGVRCVYFLEEDRNTTHGGEKLIRRKLPGYERMFRTARHVTHFGHAFGDVLPIFRVIFSTPTTGRRDALRRQMRSMTKDKPAGFADVWRFVAKPELSAETFLHGEIFYRCGHDSPAIALVAPGVMQQAEQQVESGVTNPAVVV